jgi:hypothetical protein
LAEQQFFTAAFFAFIGWFAACVLAAVRSGYLTSGSSKALCWVVPALGLIVLAYLIYDGLHGETGGFRPIALGLVSIAFYILAFALPLLQSLFGYFARVTDRDDQ